MWVVSRLDLECVHGGSLCLRSGVVLAIIVFVNGCRSRISRHDLGRDVVGMNLSGVCHLRSG